MIKHYVRFILKGEIFNNYKTDEVESRDLNHIKIPDDAIAYFFFDRNFEDNEISDPINVSPIIYIGIKYTLEEIKKDFPEEKILISNLEKNGCKTAVRTINGNWQFLRKKDITLL